MQDKLIEILSGATGWMTANKLAEKGGWRSPAHVGLALKQMPGVEHRKSATEKMGNGMPATEYKLKDKVFSGDVAESKPMVNSGPDIDVPVVRKSRTTGTSFEQKAVEIAVDRHNKAEAMGNEVDSLKAKLAMAEQQRDDHFNRAESLQAALEESDAKLGLIGTMLINIEGDSIKDKLGNVLHERLHGETKISDLEDDVRRHTESHNRLSTEISHFLTTVQQLTGIDHRPINLAESEEQIAEAIHQLRQRIEEQENALEAALQAVAAAELAAEQKANTVNVSAAYHSYMVRTPSQPPRFAKKHKNAHAVAMSAVRRRHILAEVYALVLLGKVVRGAEWRPK